MKKTLLLCLIVISSINLWSQNNYQIDSIISVNIPGDDLTIDSLLNNNIKIQFYSKIENAEFLAQKKLFENDTIGIYDSNLPYDIESLENYYQTLAKTYVKNTDFKIESEKMIEKDSLKSYHLKLVNSINHSLYEIEYFLLNKNIYLFSYKNTVESDTNEIDKFFNSIHINTDKKTSQFSGKRPFEKSAYNLGYKLGRTAAENPSYLWIAGGIFLLFIIGIIIFIVKRI